MLPGIELMGCGELAVPVSVMQHVVHVESSFNPYAIGVVGGRLVRQPRSLAEAVSTAKMLQDKGYNFSIGLAQVNKTNFAQQGIDTLEKGFERCTNLRAGARILAECYSRASKDWGKAFSCYYSGNFTTGYRHGYVQKVFGSWKSQQMANQEYVPIAIASSGAKAVSQQRLAKTIPMAKPESQQLPAYVANRIAASTSALQTSVDTALHAFVEQSRASSELNTMYEAKRAQPAAVVDNAPVTVTAFGAPNVPPPASTAAAEKANGGDSAFVF